VDPLELVSAARSHLGIDTLYMPLLYDDIPYTAELLRLDDAVVLRRRPSPTICWDRRGADLWGRCELRLGSRARRRRKRFEESGLSVRTVTGDEAMRAVDRVELSSWKARMGQDMRSRGQWAFYQHLILGGAASVRVASRDREALAYRLDMIVDRTVFCLKWSFDERSRRFSPGFYLLAVDLVSSYSDAAIDRIDLFGAPDALKDSLADGSRERLDLAWPSGPMASTVLAERAEHDRRTLTNYECGKSIRSNYRIARTSPQTEAPT
jgi:hypothetical protein